MLFSLQQPHLFTSPASRACVRAQGDRAEELRSLAFLAGIMGAFTMDALLQLDFSAPQFPRVVTCGYGLTLGISVRPWALVGGGGGG